MSLAEFIALLRRYWISMLVLVVSGMSYTVGSVLLVKPTYAATASVLLSLQSTGSPDSPCPIDVSLEESARSLASVVGTPLIIDPVIKRLGLSSDFDSVSPMLWGRSVAGTSVVQVRAIAPDPELAAHLATAAAEQVAAATSEIVSSLPQGLLMVGKSTGAAAIPIVSNNRPGLQQQALLGVLLGAFVGLTQAWVRNHLRKGSGSPAHQKRISHEDSSRDR